MRLFSFSSKSMRNRSKSKATGGVVGGGNWQDNAENLGSFLLRQTIASALPPPGYSKARPHVWALSLPNGAVHLFQVGTPEIVREFVSTANYWSARLSNHPLVGGISNIEYGWSEAIINNALVQAINDTTQPSTSGPRPSLQSSLRSSLDHGGASFRARLPGDKILVSDWTPPTQSMRASNLMEQDQLRTLTAYVQGIEEELQKHNQLRSSMLLAVSSSLCRLMTTILMYTSSPLAITTRKRQWQTGKRSLPIFCGRLSSFGRTLTVCKRLGHRGRKFMQREGRTRQWRKREKTTIERETVLYDPNDSIQLEHFT
jgi:hypothetical protein